MASKHSVMLDVAVIAAPAALVLGARLLFSPAPAAPGAGGGEAAAAVFTPASVTKKASPDQERAAEWIRALGDTAGMRSPMAHPIPAPVVVQAEPEQPEGTPLPEAPKESPIAGLRLTGVLGNSDGALAVLNGKVYKVGDVVKPGVTLSAIDVRINTVTFKLADGGEVKIARQLDPLGK